MKDLRDSLSSRDPPRTLRRLLAVVVAAFDLLGGRIELERPGVALWTANEGERPTTDPVVTASAALGTGRVSLILNPSRRSGALSLRDRTAIEHALTAVAAELA